jgi:hypothetical protein
VFESVLGPAFVVAGVAVMAFREIADETAKAVQADFDAIRDSSIRHNEAMKAMEAASVKALKGIEAEIDSTIARYKELESQAASATAHADAVTKATRKLEDAQFESDKQDALAKAKTPEQKAAVERDFAAKAAGTTKARASADIDNELANAKIAQTRTTNAANEASQSLREADLDVSSKQDDVATKKRAAEEALIRERNGLGSAADRKDAVHAYETAQAALTSSQTNRDTISKQAAPILADAQKADANVNTLTQLAPVKQKTVSLEAKNTINPIMQEQSSERNTLAAKANEQQAAGDYTGQSQTVAAIKQLDASLKANGGAVAGAVKDVTKTVDKNTDKINATRESGGGG